VASDVLPAALGERRPPRRARVVDEQVEPLVVLLHVRAHARRSVVLGQVDGAAADGAAELARQRAQPVLAAGDEHERGAVLAGEKAGGRFADTARGAGDDGDGHVPGMVPDDRAAQPRGWAARPGFVPPD
jgi:hypothetical protein